MNTNLFTELNRGIEAAENSGDTKISAYVQEIYRPEIDSIICRNLEGDALKEALFIVDNIRENKMKIKWSAVNVWEVKFRGRHVCNLTVVHGALRIGHVSNILATRVRKMSNDFEYTRRLVDAITNSMSEKPATSVAAG